MKHSLKICMLGDFAVGKTALVERFVHDRFSSDYKATLGVQISKYNDRFTLGALGARDIDLIIWDIEGNLNSESLQRTYTTGASGAMIVTDASRPEPEESLLRYSRLFQSLCPGRAVVFIFNKMDLQPDLVASDTLSERAADLAGMVAYTSALTGSGVQQGFRTLVSHIAKVEQWR